MLIIELPLGGPRCCKATTSRTCNEVNNRFNSQPSFIIAILNTVCYKCYGLQHVDIYEQQNRDTSTSIKFFDDISYVLFDYKVKAEYFPLFSLSLVHYIINKLSVIVFAKCMDKFDFGSLTWVLVGKLCCSSKCAASRNRILLIVAVECIRSMVTKGVWIVT